MTTKDEKATTYPINFALRDVEITDRQAGRGEQREGGVRGEG